MSPISYIAQDIDDYVEYSAKMMMVCEHLSIRMPASPLLNFRDALSHYVCLYEAKTIDNEEKLKQETSIDEHLSRGFKDLCVHLLYEMKDRVIEAFEAAKTKTEKNIFRKYMHECKRMELEIRRNSRSAGIKSIYKFADNLIVTIKKIESVFQDYHVPFKANANHRLP